MYDLMLYCAMGIVLFFILVAIVRGSESPKSYIAMPDRAKEPKLAETKPLRNKRSQEIWNRLNPKVYLDDDETEPMPQKRIRTKIKQS